MLVPQLPQVHVLAVHTHMKCQHHALIVQLAIHAQPPILHLLFAHMDTILKPMQLLELFDQRGLNAQYLTQLLQHVEMDTTQWKDGLYD